IQSIVNETKALYENSMKKSQLQHVLVAPNVKGLENEIAGPPLPDPVGCGNTIQKKKKCIIS
ncbi:unnamed protein product, partial [Rotaria sp. Silwood2]